jgi:AraC-like DNA-binding protein
MRKLDANARVQYREHTIPDSLRGHVAGVWHLRDASATRAPQTIYPDGFCELIVHLGSPPECLDDHGWHAQSDTLFAAQRLSAVRLRRDAPLDCMGVRLQPEASDLLGVEALRRSRERIVDLAGIDAGLSRALRAAVHAFAAGDTARLWLLLVRRITPHRIDDAVARAVRAIQGSGGRMRIETVARAAGFGLRSLQTRFGRAVGLTPKEFARLIRLQATLRSLDAEELSLSELAADHGFADQAHATRELRRVTGLAPARLRAALRADREGEAAVRLAAAFVRGAG